MPTPIDEDLLLDELTLDDFPSLDGGDEPVGVPGLDPVLHDDVLVLSLDDAADADLVLLDSLLQLLDQEAGGDDPIDFALPALDRDDFTGSDLDDGREHEGEDDPLDDPEPSDAEGGDEGPLGWALERDLEPLPDLDEDEDPPLSAPPSSSRLPWHDVGWSPLPFPAPPLDAPAFSLLAGRLLTATRRLETLARGTRAFAPLLSAHGLPSYPRLVALEPRPPHRVLLSLADGSLGLVEAPGVFRALPALDRPRHLAPAQITWDQSPLLLLPSGELLTLDQNTWQTVYGSGALALAPGATPLLLAARARSPGRARLELPVIDLPPGLPDRGPYLLASSGEHLAVAGPDHLLVGVRGGTLAAVEGFSGLRALCFGPAADPRPPVFALLSAGPGAPAYLAQLPTEGPPSLLAELPPLTHLAATLAWDSTRQALWVATSAGLFLHSPPR
jgi:hypothetical protein